MVAGAKKTHILIIASKNKGKILEMSASLCDFSLEVKTLHDFPQIDQISEDGKSFMENALMKARHVHKTCGNYVLADDSGIECDDLGGAPGIYSARFAGNDATDEENNQKLIDSLQALGDPSRLARYVCAMVLIEPSGKETQILETCEGMITFTPNGSGGFGYDPYFYLPDKKCTMAELTLIEKNKISHRGKAMQRVRDLLQEIFL